MMEFIFHIKNFDFIEKYFGDIDEINFELNWLFLSTSGVHGSYRDINDIREAWEEKKEHNVVHVFSDFLTVLIIQPRTVSIYYGNIKIESDDQLTYLQELSHRTMQGIIESQKYNLIQERMEEIFKNINWNEK